MLRKLKNQKGFTLIEVLVVVIIVAILAALAVPIYMRHVEKSRSAEAQTAIGAIATLIRFTAKPTAALRTIPSRKP